VAIQLTYCVVEAHKLVELHQFVLQATKSFLEKMVAAANLKVIAPHKQTISTKFHSLVQSETSTTDPYAGCESCRDGKLSVSDYAAGFCGPQINNGECHCLCADLFCFNGEVIDRSTCVNGGEMSQCRCIPGNETSSTVDPYVGCESCLNSQLGVSDNAAGQCFAQPSNEGCHCLCGDLFCQEGEIIDRSTCVNGGDFNQCRCIPNNETVTTSDPYAGCESCRDGKLGVSDTAAGYCGPRIHNGECHCLCADLFCFDGEVIDRSTCVNGGEMSQCHCIPGPSKPMEVTESPPISTEITEGSTSTVDPYDGCESCLNSQLGVSDNAAGQCFAQPSNEGCHCLCGDLFCQEGEIIDRSTCVNGGDFNKCRCIPGKS